MNSLSSLLSNSWGKLIAILKVLVPGGHSLSHTNKTAQDCALIDDASVRGKAFTGNDFHGSLWMCEIEDSKYNYTIWNPVGSCLKRPP